MNPIKRVRVRVEGTVQGVFFRASTRARAQSLGLTGWVRNTPDGAVELEAQGPEPAIDQLLEWCHEGPPAAHVESVSFSDDEPRSDESDFEIHR